jgi:hypothetical protein
MANSTPGWFYQARSGPVGPITLEALRDLLERREISSDTLVWNETFGGSWKSVRDTEIVPNKLPPPLPVSASAAPKKSRVWRAWIVPVIGAIVLFWLLGGFIWVFKILGYDTETMLSNELPKCNSSMATGLAKQAIEGAPMAKMLSMTVFDIRDAEELRYDAIAKKRACKAMAFLNSGKQEIIYTIEWQNEAEGRVWLQINPF